MPAVAPDVGAVVLAERGVGPYLQYRIPGIAALPASPGTLLCAYDARLNLDDLPAPIDLLLRRSEDSGRTWSAPTLVRGGDSPASFGTRAPTGFEGFGDPSLLTDPATGRVLMFHSATVYAGFFESSDSLSNTDPHVQHADLSVSDDGGRTWRHRRLSASLRRSGNRHFAGGSPGTGRIAGLFATSGAGCAITGGPFSGRLVQPYVLREAGRIHVACALSDDHGETWRLGAPVPVDSSARTELNESSVTALPEGRLVLHSRGLGARLQAYSDDGGETFSAATPVPALVDSGTNGSVLAVGTTLFASHTADPDLRRRAVISRSDDGGTTWREVRVIAPGAAGYTQLVALPDDHIGVVHEANGYQQIRFESYAPAELGAPVPAAAGDPTGAEPPAAAAVLAPGWHRGATGDLVWDVVLRSITPPPPPEGLGRTHEIPLEDYADIPVTVFKEIGRTDEPGLQVLHTRESLRGASQARSAGAAVLAGEALSFHGRVRNTGTTPAVVDWAGEHRILAPGEDWIRRDLTHTLAHTVPAGSELTDLAPRPETAEVRNTSR